MSRHDHDVRAPSAAIERARSREAARRSQRTEHAGVPGSLDVHVDDLAEGALDIDTVMTATALSELLDEHKEIEWTARGDAKVALRLEREAGFVRARGSVSFSLQHPCVRCLNPVPFEVPLDVDLRLVRKEGHDIKAPDGEESEGDLEEGLATGDDLDDLGVASYTGEVIHLAEVLREQLFLELPMHPACNSPRARPAAPCSFDEGGALKKEQERWVDPRWAGLAKLKGQLAAGEQPRAAPKAVAPNATAPAAPTPAVPLPGRETPIALPGRLTPVALPGRKPADPRKATKKAPAKKAPAKKAPAKKAPAKKAPAKKAPAKKAPAKKAPARKTPAKKAPAKKAPAKKAPAKKKARARSRYRR